MIYVISISALTDHIKIMQYLEVCSNMGYICRIICSCFNTNFLVFNFDFNTKNPYLLRQDYTNSFSP